MSFSQDIRRERRRLRLTQAQAAALLDVSRDTVASWESERNTPISLTQEGALTRLRALEDALYRDSESTFFRCEPTYGQDGENLDIPTFLRSTTNNKTKTDE